jgi:hypothetical protein
MARIGSAYIISRPGVLKGKLEDFFGFKGFLQPRFCWFWIQKKESVNKYHSQWFSFY